MKIIENWASWVLLVLFWILTVGGTWVPGRFDGIFLDRLPKKSVFGPVSILGSCKAKDDF